MIDLKDLKERVSSLQKQYNEILTERANLESSIQDSKSRLDKLRQTRTDYNQDLSQISRNPVTRDQKKTALDAKYNISDVTTEIENIEKSIETNLAQKRVLDTSEKSLNDEYAELYSSFIQIIDQEQRTISERFTSYQNDKSEIQSLSQIEAEIDTLQSSIHDLVIQKQNMGIDPDSEMFYRAQQDLDKKIAEANEQMSKLLERRDSIISLQAKNNDIDPKLMEQEWDQLETLKSTLKNPNIKSSKTKSKGRKRNNPNQFELGIVLDEILEEINQIDPSIKTSSEELAEQVAEEAKKAEEIAARKSAEEEARKNAEEEARKKAEEEEETFLDDFDSYQSTKSTPSPTLEELWKQDEELYSTYEAEEEEAKKIAEEEAARKKAEEEAARIKAAEEEAARIKAAEEEAARIKAAEEEEAARIKAAEEEAARIKAAEEEAARIKAEEKTVPSIFDSQHHIEDIISYLNSSYTTNDSPFGNKFVMPDELDIPTEDELDMPTEDELDMPTEDKLNSTDGEHDKDEHDEKLDEEKDPYENELDDDEKQKDAYYDIYNDPDFSYLFGTPHDDEKLYYDDEHDDEEHDEKLYYDDELDDEELDEEELDEEELDEEELDEEELDDDELDDDEIEDDEIEDADFEDADFEEDKKPRFLHKLGNAIHNGFSSFLRLITMKDTPQLGAGDDEYDDEYDEYDDEEEVYSESDYDPSENRYAAYRRKNRDEANVSNVTSNYKPFDSDPISQNPNTDKSSQR